MKLLLAFLISMLPLAASAQTKADYENTMQKFQHFYNNKQSDSLCKLFPPNYPRENTCFFPPGMLDTIMNKFGRMLSYKYIATDKNGSAYFKTVYTRSTQMTSLFLNNENKLKTVRLTNHSPYTDSLLLKH